MALTMSTDQVDSNHKEQLSYGTPDFPIAFFDDDLTKVKVPWHWHEELELVMVLKGNVRISIGGAQFDLNAGEGYFANSGILHAADLLSEKGHQHAMVFDRHVPGREGDIIWTQYIQPVLEHTDLQYVKLSPAVPYQREILRLSETAWAAGAYETEDHPLTVRDCLSRILALLLRNADSMKPEPAGYTRSQRDEFRVKKALVFIKAHCAEQLTIEDIADSADISVSVCLRSFHNVLHTTPIQYLRKYRLDQCAAALCSQSGRSVSDIAAVYGFTDMSYFDRCFKKEFGLTPSEYRQNH